MGQAKTRGSKEKRIAQSKAKKEPPEIGVYVYTKKPLGMRFVVEDVSFVDETFFLVEMVEEFNAHDINAIRYEFDPEEWFALVDQYGLIKSES